jgi:hypothetical protein
LGRCSPLSVRSVPELIAELDELQQDLADAMVRCQSLTAEVFEQVEWCDGPEGRRTLRAVVAKLEGLATNLSADELQTIDIRGNLGVAYNQMREGR